VANDALERPGDFIIATGECHSLEDFVQRAFAEVGLDWRDHVTIDPALHRPLDILANVVRLIIDGMRDCGRAGAAVIAPGLEV
jgi:GDP-D-mannose dehydratase